MDKRVSIPKILNVMLVSLLLCNVVQAESSLSKCKGDDDTQWKNCQGMYYKDHPKRRGYKVRYTGEFGDVAGMRNGQGTSEIYKKGKLFGTYVGVFKDNKYNGQGVYTWADGKKYVGEFKDGKRNGQGTFTTANGKNKYVGEWKNDKTHGQGIWTKLKSN